jgi:hypothetical protein
MLRHLFREVGLAAASLLASLFGMTAVFFFGIVSLGLADPDLSMISLVLTYYILPFSVGLGALVAAVLARWNQTSFRAVFLLILGIGVLFAVLMGLWMGYVGWTLFFLMPGFVLWGALSGWFARRRSAQGMGVGR